MKSFLFSFYPRFLQLEKNNSWMALVLTAVFIFLSSTVVEQSSAQGGLQVLPTRVVFEGRTRSAQIHLLNQGKEKATYRISFKNMRMTETGGYEDVKEPLPGEQFAADFIRYSPRQIEIEPGASQTIRLLLRKKSDLLPGEYRSHMLFSTVPPKDTGKDIESLASGQEKLEISLTPIFGVTIPVIVRHGKGSATAGMADFQIHAPEKPEDKSSLSFNISRQGDQSLFGDISIKFTPQNGADETEVGRLNGVAVFTPNKSRKINLFLAPPKGLELKQGLLNITYKDHNESKKVLASGQLKLP